MVPNFGSITQRSTCLFSIKAQDMNLREGYPGSRIVYPVSGIRHPVSGFQV